MFPRAHRPPPSPMVVLAIGLGMVVIGAYMLSTQLRIRAHGHRVLARIASVTHHRRSSSTTLHFNTLPGAAATCVLDGVRGSVGQPLWIRYLASEPSTCSSDDNAGLHRSVFLLGLGTLVLVGAWSLYQRARRGEPVSPSGRRVPARRPFPRGLGRTSRQRRTRRDVSS